MKPAPKEPVGNAAPPPPKAAGPSAEKNQLARGRSSGSFLRQTPAWLVSMLLHVVVLLSLALMVAEEPSKPAGLRTIDSPPTESMADVEEVQTVELPTPEEVESKDVPEEVAEEAPAVAVESMEVASTVTDVAATDVSADTVDVGANISVSTDILKTVSTSGPAKTGLAARSNSAGQKAMIKAGGGDPDEVIRSVEKACDWFVRHQLPDGGWSFDCSQIPGCMGKCGNPKNTAELKNRDAATALALLPMLGHGYTHMARGEKGKYAKHIDRGLAFLSQSVIRGKGAVGSKAGAHGKMYTQGLAGVVLSEAYGMTKDKRLLLPAQSAMDYIMMAQDPNGGGWGYSPRSPGDTSIVCWQIMAIKSGAMSGLEIDRQFIPKLSFFLDSVETDDGAGYGYRGPGDTPALTPAGLLCRMFTTWKKTNDALIRGAKKTAARGPSRDMYASYYATQVLFHLKQQLPEEWQTWQKKMTRMLVDAQITAGHEAGSIFEGFGSHYAATVGGRIYVSSMATMTLEVYFKHGLPLYQQEADTADDFVE